MVEPATAAIAVLSTIAGVSGYGAMKINSNQARVMDETANRLAAEKIEKVRRELATATEQMKAQAERDLQIKQKEVDDYKLAIKQLEAAKKATDTKLQQATEGERLFASVSLPGFKKAIKTFQKQRLATDGDEAMGAKLAGAVEKVFDNYTSSARLTISRGSLQSLYSDLSKAAEKPYMDREEFDRTLTEILRGVDASLQGDKSAAEAKKAEEAAQSKAKAAEAATAAAALKESKKAEAASAAALKESKKEAADKQGSTKIHDTLIQSMKDALQWYTTTIKAIEDKQNNELKVFLTYAPKDKELKEELDDALLYSTSLEKYKDDLQKKYDTYKNKVGTKKFSLVKYIRGQDNLYKPLDESFFEKNPKPLPKRRFISPIGGSVRGRKRGGALDSLIASKKEIDVDIDFFQKVKSDAEAYVQKLNEFIRKKRSEIQELGLQPEDEGEAVAETVAEATPDETAFNVENPVMEAAKAELEGKTPAPFTTGSESADKKVVKSLKGFESPALKNMKTKTRRNKRISDSVSRKNQPTLDGGPAAGTGLLPRGGLRKKKLRTRRGGKQRNNV